MDGEKRRLDTFLSAGTFLVSHLPTKLPVLPCHNPPPKKDTFFERFENKHRN